MSSIIISPWVTTSEDFGTFNIILQLRCYVSHRMPSLRDLLSSRRRSAHELRRSGGDRLFHLAFPSTLTWPSPFPSWGRPVEVIDVVGGWSRVGDMVLICVGTDRPNPYARSGSGCRHSCPTGCKCYEVWMFSLGNAKYHLCEMGSFSNKILIHSKFWLVEISWLVL